jgi:uncharacterized protein
MMDSINQAGALNMNPQEKVQLEQFLQQLNSTQAGAKDSDADSLIAESIKRQPDASYLLVQRAMGLEMALQVAQKQMAEMQAQIDQANKPSSGFLSGINSWGRAAPAQGAPVNAMATAKPASGAAQPSAWGSGMLGAIATTAIGVVAGSMLYQGIQSMMGQSSAPDAGSGLGHSNTPTDSGQQMAQNYDNSALDYDGDFGGDFDSDGFA